MGRFSHDLLRLATQVRPEMVPLIDFTQVMAFLLTFSKHHKTLAFIMIFGTRQQKLKNLIAAVFRFPDF